MIKEILRIFPRNRPRIRSLYSIRVCWGKRSPNLVKRSRRRVARIPPRRVARWPSLPAAAATSRGRVKIPAPTMVEARMEVIWRGVICFSLSILLIQASLLPFFPGPGHAPFVLGLHFRGTLAG